MVGFFLAFCFTIPFLFIHTSKITHLFSIKSVIMPAAGLGIVIWATSKNGGVSSGNLQASAEYSSTSVLAWGIVAQFNAVMGSNSALLVTVPDLARYSKTKNAQLIGQLISLPIGQSKWKPNDSSLYRSFSFQERWSPSTNLHANSSQHCALHSASYPP